MKGVNEKNEYLLGIKNKFESKKKYVWIIILTKIYGRKK